MAADPLSRKSKPGNSYRTNSKLRRHQHLLDVGVRAGQAGRQRNRRLFALFSKLSLALGLIAGLYFGTTKALALLLLKNPEYNVTELNVETDGVLPSDRVLAAADLHKGENIFLLNLNRAKARVEAIPEVEKVQVTRQLPNRITIQINERKPVAWITPDHGPINHDDVASSKNVYLIDARGIVLQPRKLAPQDNYLPMIRNYTNGPLTDGQEADGEEVHAALDLIHAHQDSLIAARFQIQEIDLARHFGLQVTDHTGLQVLFGLDDMDRQLKRLDVLLQTIDGRGQKPQTINLLVQRYVPVTFVTDPVPMDKPTDTPAASPSVVANNPKNAGSGGKDKDKAREKQKSGDKRHRH